MRNASSVSLSSGLLYKKPWTSLHPAWVKKSACSVVSTPSAMTVSPKLEAKAMMALEMAISSLSVGMSRMKLRSIFSL